MSKHSGGGGTGDTGYRSGGNGNGKLKGRRSRPGAKAPALDQTKSVSYSATVSDQIFSVSGDPSVTSKSPIPSAVEVTNNGSVPIILMLGYETYSDDTSDGVTEYLHTMVMPGASFLPPIRAVIRTGESTVIMDGTAVDNLAPDSNEYTDSTADIDSATAAGIVGNATNTTVYLEPYTSAANCTANLFRVGDLIRVRNEVMEVTAIGDKSDLANNYLTVKRDMYGTDGGTAAVDDDPVRFPFFNAYHDYDKYSVAQTDSNGKFKCFNLFGQGRSATESQGLIPGSFAVKFYDAGYRNLGLSGITSSTNTSLTASGSYWFKIAIDGGTAESINFTVDSSNTNWGGTNGVISKIQAALNDKYNNTASNTFNQKSTIGIVNGDVRFTSGQRLSTSAIALTAGVDGASASYNIFAQQNGWFPALANVPDAVAAKLPDDVIYDRITYSTSPNSTAFGYDDGWGNLQGMCSGSINYETGALDMQGCPVNAEFVVSALTNSVFSGRITESTTDRINVLVDVYANTTSVKATDGSVRIRAWR